MAVAVGRQAMHSGPAITGRGRQLNAELLQGGTNVLAWRPRADAAGTYRDCGVPLPPASPNGDPQYGLLLHLVAVLPIELDGRGLKIAQVTDQDPEIRKANRLLKACAELLACAADLPRTRAEDGLEPHWRT